MSIYCAKQKYGLFAVSFEVHTIRMHESNIFSQKKAVFLNFMHFLEKSTISESEQYQSMQFVCSTESLLALKSTITKPRVALFREKHAILRIQHLKFLLPFAGDR